MCVLPTSSFSQGRKVLLGLPQSLWTMEGVGSIGSFRSGLTTILLGTVDKTKQDGLSNDETHHKVAAEYFLTPDEKQLFIEKNWSLDWPAVLFSIDAKEKGASLAGKAVRKRLRSGGDVSEDPFPCIVLTGLGYETLMGKEADLKLRELRDFIVEVPNGYDKSVPLTYGPKVDVGVDGTCSETNRGQLRCRIR